MLMYNQSLKPRAHHLHLQRSTTHTGVKPYWGPTNNKSLEHLQAGAATSPVITAPRSRQRQQDKLCCLVLCCVLLLLLSCCCCFG